MASLDPRLPVHDLLAEPLEAHGVPEAEHPARVRDLLQLVGLQPEHAGRYPQALSGGQRQTRRNRAGTGAGAPGAGARRTGFGTRRLDPRGP